MAGEGSLGPVPQSSLHSAYRWFLGWPAEAVDEGIPGHSALLRDEANMSGAGGERIRAVSIWGGFFKAPRRKRQLPLNIGKKTNTKNCNFGRRLLRIQILGCAHRNSDSLSYAGA